MLERVDMIAMKTREECHTKLLNDPCVLAACKLGVILRLCTSDDHLSRGKDQSSGLGFANTHDDSSETLRICTRVSIHSRQAARRLR